MTKERLLLYVPDVLDHTIESGRRVGVASGEVGTTAVGVDKRPKWAAVEIVLDKSYLGSEENEIVNEKVGTGSRCAGSLHLLTPPLILLIQPPPPLCVLSVRRPPSPLISFVDLLHPSIYHARLFFEVTWCPVR